MEALYNTPANLQAIVHPVLGIETSQPIKPQVL